MKMVLDTKKLDTALYKIAMAIDKNIKDLTRMGVDMNRIPFEKYEKYYANRKLEYTRGKRDISAFRIARASHVNLKLKGTMIQAMAVGRIKDGYEIYFEEKTMAIRAWWHHTGQGNNPVRKFFGIAPEREKQLYNKYMPKDVARFA